MNTPISPATPPTDAPFSAEVWAKLPDYFTHLPHRVQINVWGDAESSLGERDALRLVRVLARRFETITFEQFPQRDDYPFYPVLGVMGLEADGSPIDYGVRIIGHPGGNQMTSLITAIQAVAFRGASLAPRTRLRLTKLTQDVELEVLSDAEDEVGPALAKHAFGLAVASPRVRAFLIMADVFPEALLRYSVNYLPHTVINGRYHVAGALSETELLQHVARALNP